MKTYLSKIVPACRVSLGLLMVLVAGCQSTDLGSAQSFSVGVTAVRAQSQSTFDTVAVLTRETSLQYAAAQPTLTEASFVTVPDAAAVAAWHAMLAPVETYARNLSALVAVKATENVESSVEALASQFNTTSENLQKQAALGNGTQLGAGGASAFAGVASALLRAKAHKDAQKIAAAVDPEIRVLFMGLAETIGNESAGVGLRATVARNWEQRLAVLKQEFLSQKSSAKREAIAKKFVGFLNQRDAQDEMLAGVHRTLVALADAHTALAKGNALDLRGAIDFVAAELKHTRDLKTRFTETLSK